MTSASKCPGKELNNVLICNLQMSVEFRSFTILYTSIVAKHEMLTLLLMMNSRPLYSMLPQNITKQQKELLLTERCRAP